MFQRFLFITLVGAQVVAGLTGCSIVQPHPDLTESLQAARIIGGVSVENPSRLILPQFAPVTVNHADGRVDHERLYAAQTGLASYFSIAAGDAPWQINVHWPDSAYAATDEHAAVAPPAVEPESGSDRLATAGKQAIKRAGHYLVRTADRDILIVDVVQTASQTVVTRLEVNVEPWLRGRDWHDPVAITRTFMAVGAALSGT